LLSPGSITGPKLDRSTIRGTTTTNIHAALTPQRIDGQAVEFKLLVWSASTIENLDWGSRSCRACAYISAKKPSIRQGCSTLWDDEKSEQIIDAGKGGAVAVLAERAGAVGFEDIKGETAQAGEHAGIGADARAVFAEGDITAVVGSGLDLPMRAHRLSGAGGGERGIRDIEGGLGGKAQQPGPGIAGEDIALDPDDGGDVGVPVGVGQFVGGIEDADGAGFVAVATLVAAMG
jgi:hypothetical protein